MNYFFKKICNDHKFHINMMIKYQIIKAKTIETMAPKISLIDPEKQEKEQSLYFSQAASFVSYLHVSKHGNILVQTVAQSVVFFQGIFGLLSIESKTMVTTIPVTSQQLSSLDFIMHSPSASSFSLQLFPDVFSLQSE